MALLLLGGAASAVDYGTVSILDFSLAPGGRATRSPELFKCQEESCTDTLLLSVTSPSDDLVVSVSPREIKFSNATAGQSFGTRVTVTAGTSAAPGNHLGRLHVTNGSGDVWEYDLYITVRQRAAAPPVSRPTPASPGGVSGDEVVVLISYVVPGLLAGIGIFIFSFRSLWRKRLIEGTPTSKARAVAMGPVELAGTVEPYQGKVLKAPFSRRECVYYVCSVDELQPGEGEHSLPRWVSIARDQQAVPFLLRDETGAVLVGPEGADMEVSESFRLRQGKADPPDAVKEFMVSRGMEIEGPMGIHRKVLGVRRKLQYWETSLALKGRVYVLGTAGDNPFMAEGTAVRGSDDVMVQRARGNPFIITDKSEKALRGQELWGFWLGIGIGAALTVGCLILLLGAFSF